MSPDRVLSHEQARRLYDYVDVVTSFAVPSQVLVATRS